MLCDTNGGSLPPQIRTALAVVREALPRGGAGDPLPRRLRLRGGQHADRRRSRAPRQVQGTMNGIGERTGNANLVTIIADLQLKMGVPLLAPEQLARLTETAHFVDELLNRSPEPDPALRRQARLRAQGRPARRRRARRREHLRARRPRGRRQQPRAAGLRALGQGHDRARRPRARASPPTTSSSRRVLARVKELEHEGYQFEAADGSFELLMRREPDGYEPLFRSSPGG